MSDFAPPLTYWNPYSRKQEPVLTEAEVQSMWPYNKRSGDRSGDPNNRKDEETHHMVSDRDWLEDCMPTIPAKHPVDKRAAQDVEGHKPSYLKWPKGCYHCKDGEDPCICPGPRNGMEPKEAVRLANLGEAMEANINATADMVNLPSHYARFKIEPMRFIVENLGPGFLIGNIIKYTMRYDAKNGLEDLRKARRCQDMLIAYVGGDPDWWKVREKA